MRPALNHDEARRAVSVIRPSTIQRGACADAASRSSSADVPKQGAEHRQHGRSLASTNASCPCRGSRSRHGGTIGAVSFGTGTDAYGRSVGRYSAALASAFCEAAGVGAEETALEVGCGPGALVRRARASGSAAGARPRGVEPSEPFLAKAFGVQPMPASTSGLAGAESRRRSTTARSTFRCSASSSSTSSPTRARRCVPRCARVARPKGMETACVLGLRRRDHHAPRVLGRRASSSNP